MATNDNWEDVVKRRQAGDPLMMGGKCRQIKDIKSKNIKCPRNGCQSKNITLEFNYGICHDCDYAWKRRK